MRRGMMHRRGFFFRSDTITPKKPPVRQKRTFPTWIYVISDGLATKVGVAEHLASRVASIQGGNPRPIAIQAAWRMRTFDYAFLVEQLSLNGCMRHRALGEWVNSSPKAVARLVAWIIGNPSKAKVKELNTLRDIRLGVIRAGVIASTDAQILDVIGGWR